MATKRKMRRYDDGGEVDPVIEDESDRGSMTAEQKASSDEINAPKTFKEAFAAARSGKIGDGKTFTFNGKKYTTDLAAPKSSAKSTLTTKSAAATPAPAEKYETSFDRMNRKNREAGTDFDSLVSRGVNAVKERLSGNASGQRGQDRVVRDAAIRKSDQQFMGMKKGGSVKVSSASSRADGIAQRGKTRGTLAKHGK